MAGVSSPSHLAAVAENARRLRAGGDLASARAVLEQALLTGRPAYGEDHPEVLLTAHLLAGVHREMGDPSAARRVLEESLDAGLRRFGEGDRVMLAISFDLGGVAEELGNRHEARKNFARVAAAGPGVLGADHWMVRTAQSYLGDETPAAPPTVIYTEPGQELAPPPEASRFSVPPAEPPPFAPPPPTAQPSAFGAPPPQPRAFNAPAPLTAPPAPQSSAPIPYTDAPRGQTQADPYADRFAGVSFPDDPGRGNRFDQPAVPAPTSVSAPPSPSNSGVKKGRTATVAASVAAVAALVAAVLAAVAVLGGGDKPPPVAGSTTDAATQAPVVTAAPPTGLKLDAQGEAVGLSWADPADGRVPFVVTGGRRGERQAVMAQLDPGATTYRVNGLNPKLDYCFTVIALYSATQLAKSDQVCTSRATGSPTA